MNSQKSRIPILLFVVAVVAFVSFSPVLKGGFINWDDEGYVTSNRAIRSFAAENIVKIFTSPVIGSYTPVTLLSFSLDYRLFHLNPAGFHAMNLLFHILNCLLVFWLIHILSGKIWVSFLTALLFGIHPLHVESVAWISERKDVLYAFFFLSSIIAYLYFLGNNRLKYYAVSLFLFVLSVLSKPMAVTLPLVILLCMYFVKKPSSPSSPPAEGRGKIFIGLIPFFVVSAVAGYIAVFLTGKQPDIVSNINFIHRIFLACFSFMFYLGKAILPVKLSAVYPFTERTGNSFYPVYVMSVFLVIIVAVFAVYSSRHTKKIYFGFLFYLLTLIPVLNLVSVRGHTVVADRYTYVPLVGLFYIFAEGIDYLAVNRKHIRGLLVFAVMVIAAVLSSVSFNRSKTWENSLVLWDDVLKNYPKVSMAYNSRGSAYMDLMKYDNALSDFTMAVRLDPLYAVAYSNRALVYHNRGEYEKAVNDYVVSIKLDPKYPYTYFKLGNTFAAEKDYDRAIAEYNRALDIKKNMEEVYNNRGMCYWMKKDYDKALADFNRALEINPGFESARRNKMSVENHNTGPR